MQRSRKNAYARAGDFKAGDLGTALDPYLHQIAEEMQKYCADRKTVAFLPLVKQKYGIIERENYNKPKSENAIQPKFPPGKEAVITETLKYFGMI